LAGLEGGTVVEAVGKRFRIGTFVIGPAHCGAKCKRRVASYM
jgi:hypothetical protein